MLKVSDIQQKLLKPSKLLVLEIFIDEQDIKHYSLSEYENKKEKVVLKSEIKKIENEEQLLVHLKEKGIPIVLCVDGKGILIKKLPATDESIENLAQRIIPNVKAEDFYLEQVITNEESCQVSLIRKSSLDPLLETILDNGNYITHLHLGPAVTSCLASIIAPGNTLSEIYWRNYKLLFSPEALNDLSRKANPEESALPFEKEQFLKFAAAVSFFSGWQEMNSVLSCEKINRSSSDYTAKKKFTFYAYATIFFFLTLLLSNFFVFQHYWNKQQQLESQIGWQESAVKNYDDLKKTINEKMNFAMETGLLSEEKLAWLADQLGSTVPENVKLTRLNIYPREKKITEDDETYIFNQRNIQLTGYSDSEGILNDWIKAIKEKEFTGKVKLSSFLQNEEKKTGVFTLEIELK